MEEGIKQCKLIAVHAGLEKNRGLEEQLKYLKARDTRIPKVEALSGRKNVWEMPKVNVCPCLVFHFSFPNLEIHFSSWSVQNFGMHFYI